MQKSTPTRKPSKRTRRSLSSADLTGIRGGRDYFSEPGKIDLPNLKITLSE